MEPEGRRPDRPVGTPDEAPELAERAYLFDFFQAVRLLQGRADAGEPIGRDSPPAREAVRFAARAGLGFPASAVHDVREAGGRPHMTVSFFGLTGPSGILPTYYTEMVIEEGEGGPLGAFLGMFDHRLISLFFRAWERNHPHLAADPGLRARFDGYLLALAGLAPDPSRADPGGRSYLPYAGLFANHRRSATGLRGLLEDILNGPDSPLGAPREPIEVDIIPFIGRWLPLDPRARPRLGPPGSGNRLGPGTLIGRRARDHRGKFRVRLGPLGLDTFLALLPEAPGRAHAALVEVVRDYAGPEFGFDVELVLRAEDVPSTRLGRGPDAVRLGRTWATARGSRVPLGIRLSGSRPRGPAPRR